MHKHEQEPSRNPKYDRIEVQVVAGNCSAVARGTRWWGVASNVEEDGGEYGEWRSAGEGRLLRGDWQWQSRWRGNRGREKREEQQGNRRD